MAKDVEGNAATVYLYSVAKRWYKNPQLYVCGMWANQGYVAGDGSGGNVKIKVSVLPTEAQMPLLPKLKCWYTVSGVEMIQNSAAMEVDIRGYSNYPERSGWHESAAYALSLEGGDGNFGWPNDAYKEWLLQYNGEADASQRGLSFLWKSNVNAINYYCYCNGLILKDIFQLVAEGLRYSD